MKRVILIGIIALIGVCIMGIRLTWNDNNFGEDGHKVYRDTSPMNPASLPAPIATLGPDVTQYDDGSVVEGNTYYYRVSAYVGAVEQVSDEISISASAAALPTIADENASHDADVSTTTAWSGDTGSLTSDGSSITLSGSSVTVTQTSTDITSGDWLMYMKLQLDSGYSTWTFNAAGNGHVQLSLGYDWAAGTTADGEISLAGLVSGSWTSLQVPYDYKTAPVELCIQYDSRVDVMNLFIKESGKWDYKGSVNVDLPYPSDSVMRHYHGGGGGVNARTFYWLLAKPNIVAIGDSITAGHNLYDPDPTYYGGTDDYDSTIMKHSTIYQSLRNNLIVNYGIGGNTSADIDTRINSMLTACEPSVVMLSAANNDYGASIALSQRTTNIQSSVNKIIAAGADPVLYNAVYPNSGSAGHPGNADYYKQWWDTELSNITGTALNIDIMGDSGILTGNYMDAAYTQSDGLHPNIAGYTLIGDYISTL